MVYMDMQSNRSSSPNSNNSYSPPGSPGPSQPSQHRLLNRVSTLFGGGKRKSSNNSAVVLNNAESSSTIDDPMMTSQVDSMFTDERSASYVDSMYSSLQSRRSNYRSNIPNPNAPPPLRTVQLNNPIVHLPTPPPVQANEHKIENTYQVNTPPSPSSTPQPTDQQSSTKPSPEKIEDIEKRFRMLMTEYGPSAEGILNVANLNFELKEALVRSYNPPELNRKNSTFLTSFSLKSTFGIKNKKSNHVQYSQQDQDMDHRITSMRANTAPGRNTKTRSVLPNKKFETYGRKTSRSKFKSTPEYFVHLLQETHVRDLQESEVLDLRVFLRSVAVSWTSEFLKGGGYEAITNLFKQMRDAPKRFPNDNRILQHLVKCLKTIMTHQSLGTQIVLGNPKALEHVRDILFGPNNKKQKQVYGLDITTKSQLLNLLCTLATIQSNDTEEYTHGYDVLRKLLLNRASDKIEDDDDRKHHQKYNSPFPITLKTDPKEILQMIMDNDPNGSKIGQEYQWNPDELKPRYTAWMRELQFTVEKHIETITFLASALNYNFNSAYRQISKPKYEHEAQNESSTSGTVMCEEGVVDYIITHLRLIRTVVTTQPTTYIGTYDEREQEKMRLELMMSGFDRISKILMQCPHPIIRSSYINYLKPLLNPCADLSVAPDNNDPFFTRQSSSPLTLTNPDDDEDEDDNCEISIYADDSPEDMEVMQENYTMSEGRQWRYEDTAYIDDIFHDEEYIEDHFNTDEEDDDVSMSSNNYYSEEQPTQHPFYGTTTTNAYYTART